MSDAEAGAIHHNTPKLETTVTTATVPAVTCELIDVTPEMAEEWLARNRRNRRFRPAVANKYMRDMSHGLWTFNGEPLQFDWNEDILNGQHRLTAVAKSGTTQTFLVVRGLPPEAQDTMDSGAKRTPGDVLGLHGYRDGRTMAAMGKLALQIELSPNLARESRNWSTGEILDRVQSDPYMVKVGEELLPTLPRATALLLARSVLAYSMYRLGRLNEDAMMEFFTSLGNLANLNADSPILALNRRLTAHATQNARTSFYQFEQLAYVITAWNAWRRNESRTQIKLTYGQDGRIKLPMPA